MPLQPKIAVIVAARNEQSLILDCLQSLANLDYPKNQTEIWIINDNSQDQTANIVTSFINKMQLYYFHLLEALPATPNANGKALALDFALKHIEADYYLFTDADCVVPPTWASEFVKIFTDKKNVGIITSTTTLNGHTFFAQLQAIDMIINLALLRLASLLHIPVTSMGNNMAIRAAAYKQIPGFGETAWHLTEDYLIFRQIIDKKFGFYQVFNSKSLVLSRPMDTLGQWLSQRSRWLEGAFALPFFIQLAGGAPILFYVIIFSLSVFWSFKWATLIVLFKIIIQTIIFAFFIGIHLKQKHLIKYILLYDFYAFSVNNLVFIYKIFNKKTDWKGRSYTPQNKSMLSNQ